MDLVAVMNQLRPKENVSPDMSTYDAMVAHWRGSGIPPTLQEVNDTWNASVKAEFEATALDQKRAEKAREAGVDLNTKVEALWKAIATQDTTEVDRLKIILATVEATTPKSVTP